MLQVRPDVSKHVAMSYVDHYPCGPEDTWVMATSKIQRPMMIVPNLKMYQSALRDLR